MIKKLVRFLRAITLREMDSLSFGRIDYDPFWWIGRIISNSLYGITYEAVSKDQIKAYIKQDIAFMEKYRYQLLFNDIGNAYPKPILIDTNSIVIKEVTNE